MNEDIVFTIKEHEYSAGKISAKQQFHIVRRLLPFFEGFVQGGNVNTESMDVSLGAFLKVAGTMPDEPLDYIIDNCISVVKRKDGNVWAAISTQLWNGKSALQYEDIDMTALLMIVFNVIKRNLSGFFDALPSDLQEKFKGAAELTL